MTTDEKLDELAWQEAYPCPAHQQQSSDDDRLALAVARRACTRCQREVSSIRAALAEAVAMERARCAHLVEHARVAANWNVREALAKQIREGER